MKIKIILVFLAIIVLSSIFPIIDNYSDKKEFEIPKHQTLDEVVYKQLPKKIKEEAAKKECRGYIRQVEEMKAPNKSLSFLKENINITLLNYGKWKVIVDQEEEQVIKKRFNDNLKNWSILFSGDELENILIEDANIVKNTNYSTQAKWYYIKTTDGNNAKLVLKINHELTTETVFIIDFDFIHPDLLKQLMAERDAKEKKIKILENLSDLSMKILYGSASLFFLFILGLFTQAAYQKAIERHKGKLLAYEIGKREQLFEAGHFVTAFELAERYLNYFPDDTEIRAFKERLLDFTNNDPKTAQIAYVEAKKLKTRLQHYPDNPQKLLLSGEEKTTLTRLLPYHPELNATYQEILQIEEKSRKSLMLSEGAVKIKTNIETGHIESAQSLLNEIKIEIPDSPELEQLQVQLDEKLKERDEWFEQINKLFCKGHVSEGSIELKDFLSAYSDVKDAGLLLNEIEQAKHHENFKLRILPADIELTVFCKSQISIGRIDDNLMPDIAFDDKRISRNHLTLSLENDVIKIQDMGSTGGTFLNGKPVTHTQLQDRDVLNIAKIKEFNIQISNRPNGKPGGILLTSQKENYLVVFSEFAFNIEGSKVINHKRDYIIQYENQIPLIRWEKDFCIWNKNKEIRAHNIICQIEVL